MTLELEFHEIADIFPLMPTEGEEWEDNVASVRKHGLHVPILLHPDGRILDGRNRYRWCQAAGVIPRTVTFQGTDEEAIDEVLILNKHRRHLTKGQWAMIGAAAETMKFGANQYSNAGVSRDTPSEKSLADVAEKVGVSRSSVARAKAIIETGNTEVIDQVKAGKKTISTAYEEATGRIVKKKTPRNYDEENRKAREMRKLLKLVEHLPPGTPPVERKSTPPVDIVKYLNKIIGIVGNIVRGENHLKAVIFNKDALPNWERREKARTLRNFAIELNDFANELWCEGDDEEMLDG